MRTTILALCAVASCDGRPPEQDQRDLIVEVQAVQARMHERYAASRRIEAAITHGDLARAHAEARTIGAVVEPTILARWQPYLASLREAAQQVVAAPDIETAARMSALLGRRCATCHEATHAKIVFLAASALPADPRLASQMVSHQIAALLMWEGLIAPSPERFARGARALAEARIAIVAESDQLPPDVAAMDDLQRLHLRARRALAARSLDERATAYGEVLSACASCHRTIRD